MSTPQSETTALDRQQQRRGRIMGATIMLVVLLPMVVAYGMFYTGIGIPTGTANKGILLDPPQAAQDLDLRELDGQEWRPSGPKKWRWIIPGAAECSETCQQNLYLTRQVHIRLAEKSGRVERIYLLLDEQIDVATQNFLAHEHPHLHVLKAEPARLREAMKAAGIADDVNFDDHYFLMDQEGIVMMAYTPAHTGQQLLDDIKRMLKYSRED
jgi:cytochrome oxidase Cu insertion factor (SCO1/SenC/PrrC family)